MPVIGLYIIKGKLMLTASFTQKPCMYVYALELLVLIVPSGRNGKHRKRRIKQQFQ